MVALRKDDHAKRKHGSTCFVQSLASRSLLLNLQTPQEPGLTCPDFHSTSPRHNTATVNSRGSEKPDHVLVSEDKCQVLPSGRNSPQAPGHVELTVSQ